MNQEMNRFLSKKKKLSKEIVLGKNLEELTNCKKKEGIHRLLKTLIR